MCRSLRLCQNISMRIFLVQYHFSPYFFPSLFCFLWTSAAGINTLLILCVFICIILYISFHFTYFYAYYWNANFLSSNTQIEIMLLYILKCHLTSILLPKTYQTFSLITSKRVSLLKRQRTKNEKRERKLNKNIIITLMIK